MPIEYQIVRCCSCLTFQVQQKKKVNKFSCRLCGTKQSLQRIYGQSYKAADLRPIVQDLNMAEGSTREEERRRKLEESSSEDEELDGYLRGDKTESVKEKVQEGLVNSVWNEFKYEDSESEEEHLDSTDDIPLNFEPIQDLLEIKEQIQEDRKNLIQRKEQIITENQLMYNQKLQLFQKQHLYHRLQSENHLKHLLLNQYQNQLYPNLNQCPLQ